MPPATASTIDLASHLKLLADPTRLAILGALAKAGELHVGAICEAVKLPQNSVSHHLSLFRVAGIVDCRREGKMNVYHVVNGWGAELLAALGPLVGVEG
jgi:DNA-binding transcriptional ArsR family regulator